MTYDANPLSRRVAELIDGAVVIPVLTIEDAATAVPLAKALTLGGLKVLEITLRTDAGLPAIRAIAEAVPDAVLGAGTVLSAAQMREAADAGCRFAVSPGATPALLEAALAADLPFLPAAATASEAMRLAEAGCLRQKIFPAEAVGGLRLLKSLGEPLPDIRFCPTGGVSAGNARDYLALRNVVCVGGSWVAPKEAVAAGDWLRIERLARDAVALAG